MPLGYGPGCSSDLARPLVVIGAVVHTTRTSYPTVHFGVQATRWIHNKPLSERAREPTVSEYRQTKTGVRANHWDHGPFVDRRCKDLSIGPQLTPTEKTWLVSCMTEKRATAPQLSRRYNLPVTTLYQWRRKVVRAPSSEMHAVIPLDLI